MICVVREGTMFPEQSRQWVCGPLSPKTVAGCWLEGQTEFRCCLCIVCLRRGAVLCGQTTEEARASSTSSQVWGRRSRFDLG